MGNIFKALFGLFVFNKFTSIILGVLFGVLVWTIVKRPEFLLELWAWIKGIFGGLNTRAVTEGAKALVK